MGVLQIADAIGTVEDVTGEKARSVGATIFVSRCLNDDEITELNEKLTNPDIQADPLVSGKTRIGL